MGQSGVIYINRAFIAAVILISTDGIPDSKTMVSGAIIDNT